MKILNYHSEELHIDSLETAKGDAWCIFGSNNSGISEFVRLLSTAPQQVQGVSITEELAVISFAQQQTIFEEELRNDNSDFLDRIDPGTPAHEFIENVDRHNQLINSFNLQDCMDKGYRQLSSGESRKLILLSVLSRNPQTILFENPYDGIDNHGCKELDSTLSWLHNQGYQIIITVNNPGDIPSWCTHLAIIENRILTRKGLLDEILPQLDKAFSENEAVRFHLDADSNEKDEAVAELVHLQDGFARYGDLQIFSGLHVNIFSGQHTLITGPNGSGKSTLLQIITGDNQNCYGNKLRIFGGQRGSGESIWELKKQMGIVSPDLHRNYYVPGSALQVILSGFFDSIGVYKHFTRYQKETALHWLDMIGLRDKSQTSFRQLSYAHQRLCLIARALIKVPRLLILDEPTQGLDQQNRASLLDFLQVIDELKVSTILYASHRTDEFLPFFHQHIDLSKN